MRLILSLVLCGVVALVAAALFLRQPALAGLVLLCALAGAAAARLWPVRRANEATSSVIPTTVLSGQGNAKQMASAVATSLSATLPAHELLEAMLQSMREGLVVVDADMRVLVSNRAAGEIHAANADLTLNARRLTDLTRNPAVLNAFSAALLRGERGAANVETAEGDSRVIDLRVAPVDPRAA